MRSGLLENRRELRQHVFQQHGQRSDRGDQQHRWIDHRRAKICPQAALAFQQGREPFQARGKGPARFTGAHHPDIKSREAARLCRHCGGERAAGAHLVPYLSQDRTGARVRNIVDDETQGAIEILPGGEHDRQFTGDLNQARPVKPATNTQFDVKQIGQRAAPADRLGAQHDLALPLQPVDQRLPVGRVYDAVNDVTAAVDGRPAKRRHLGPPLPGPPSRRPAHASLRMHRTTSSIVVSPSSAARRPASKIGCIPPATAARSTAL